MTMDQLGEPGDQVDPPPAEPAVTDVDAIVAGKVKAAVEDMEIKLGQKIESMAREIGTSLKPMIDGALTASLPGIINQVGEQFLNKLKGDDAPAQSPDAAGADAEGKSGSSAVGRLVSQVTVPDIIDMIKLWKDPGSDQQLAGVLGTFIRGMSFGQKLKVGEVTPEDLQNAIGLSTDKTR